MSKGIFRWLFDREWFAVRLGKKSVGIDIADGVKCVIVMRSWFGTAYMISEHFDDAQ